VLRIEKASDGQLIILRLSGRIRSEHLEELKAQMEGCREKVALDLADVKLVDRAAVSFLAACEAKGVELRQCTRYIRDWICREQNLENSKEIRSQK
jgi:anti-anti-sigma regulatory factor